MRSRSNAAASLFCASVRHRTTRRRGGSHRRARWPATARGPRCRSGPGDSRGQAPSEHTLAALVERRLADTLGKATAAPAVGCPRCLVNVVRRTRGGHLQRGDPPRSHRRRRAPRTSTAGRPAHTRRATPQAIPPGLWTPRSSSAASSPMLTVERFASDTYSSLRSPPRRSSRSPSRPDCRAASSGGGSPRWRRELGGRPPGPNRSSRSSDRRSG
jgi:hypothetical protein